ncbi:hypothetical protein TNCV_2171071 [Trichonephila clavipes]|nr:hypothetical protein TNCV_2171071 [Trichonephila clavipes]
MSSPGFEPSPYGTAVSVANHYTGWATRYHLVIDLEVLVTVAFPYLQSLYVAKYQRVNAKSHVDTMLKTSSSPAILFYPTYFLICCLSSTSIGQQLSRFTPPTLSPILPVPKATFVHCRGEWQWSLPVKSLSLSVQITFKIFTNYESI